MNVGGELIQLSFGPAANAITSHLCNLQGLASTSNNSSGDDGSSIPLCDPYITHAVESETYVPRVLFVDGENCFSPNWIVSNNYSNTADVSNTATNQAAPQAWDGPVQVHNLQQPTKAGYASYSLNSNEQQHQQENDEKYHQPQFVDTTQTSFTSPNQIDAFANFQNVASVLASSSSQYSRYHASKYTQHSSQFVHDRTTSSSADGRHMVWDSDEEEEEEEEDTYYNDDDAKERRKRMEIQNWNQKEDTIESEVHQSWNTFLQSDTRMKTNGSGSDNNDNQKKSAPLEDTSSNPNVMGGTSNANTSATTENNNDHHRVLQRLQWRNYFMPPHPSLSSYSAPLPFDIHPQKHQNTTTNRSKSSSSTNPKDSICYSYYSGNQPTPESSSSSSFGFGENLTQSWRQDILSEKLRKQMESCDSVKGFQVLVDQDMALFGGLASSVLEEMGEECRSAGKFTVMVSDGDCFRKLIGTDNGTDSDDDDFNEEEEANNSKYWRAESQVVESYRSDLNRGLMLNDIRENSDLVLPLSLSRSWNALRTKNAKGKGSLFEASAAGALALETATLPYRLNRHAVTGINNGGRQQRRSKVGILSGYYQGSGQSDGNDMYPFVDQLNYHEFLSSLRPTNRHCMLELSGLIQGMNVEGVHIPGVTAPSSSQLELHRKLLEGTSIERRQLEEERSRNRNSWQRRRSRPRDVEPGQWMEDSDAGCGGILSSFTPMGSCNSSAYLNRSMHKHFALSTSLRPISGSSQIADQVSSYTTMMIEGMGIRYRPEVSVSTVVHQSIANLTAAHGYGAGSYWDTIYSGGSKICDAPVLTALGNTTRVFNHLDERATGLKNSLSFKYNGYMMRDIMAGIVPEREDCSEALEQCMELRDVYYPPMSADDDEGSYFDDNED